MHPLHPQAMRLVGRPVAVHLHSGQVYHGVLHRVVSNGIYVLPGGASPVSGDHFDMSTDVTFTDGPAIDDGRLVFVPAAFFGFGLLTGLAAAGPYGYGGYGYGYPGYYW